MAIATRWMIVWIGAAAAPMALFACDLTPQPLPPDTPADASQATPGGDDAAGGSSDASSSDGGAVFGDSASIPPDAGRGDGADTIGDGGLPQTDATLDAPADGDAGETDATGEAGDGAIEDAPTEGG
jgi:hypothetical protein